MRRLAWCVAVVAAAWGVSRAGMAQEQFDKELGVTQAEEAPVAVPDAEVAAGLKTGAGAAATTSGTAAGASLGGDSYEPPQLTTTPDMDAARAAVWNSPQMLAARQYITTYGQRSRQFNSADAAAYLTRLSQFTPDEMQSWLKRYEARRAANQRSNEIARAARQTAIASDMQRLQAIRQAQQAANQWQSEAAINARIQYSATQTNAQAATLYKNLSRDQYLGAMQAGNYYDFFVNPPYWVQAAASASLPGDLPAGDPRNFIRGDVPGVDAGAGGGAIERGGGGRR